MIEQLFKYLRPVVKWVISRPASVLALNLAVAIAGFILALNLQIDNDFSKLIPKSYPSVQALNTLREQVGGEHEAAVAIHSPSLEANKRFGEDLIEPALNLRDTDEARPYFVRAEFKRDTEFLKNNALYFATDNELDLLEEYLKSTIEESKQEANPFYFELEDDTETETDSISKLLGEQYDELVGSEYYLSPDSTVLVVKFFPSGAQTDLEFIRNAYDNLNRLISRLDPASYHPDMEVVAAGRMLRTLIEIETITADVKSSFGAGVLMLLAAVVLYFFLRGYQSRAGYTLSLPVATKQTTQIPAHILIMALPLIFSLCWTAGITYLLFGTLNIMTSTLGLLLFGMGVDFGIHFFSRYAEERREGYSVDESILTTFMTTGQAIFAVGITTSAAFFILMIADFKGFSEFGFIAGIGLIFAIFAYIIFLPALLVLLERSPLLDLDNTARHPIQPTFQKTTSSVFNNPGVSITIVVIAGIATLFSVVKLPELSFEYNFAELEPDYEEYQELNALVSKAYSDRKTRNAAYIVVDQASDAPKVAEILRQRAEADDRTPTIESIETFQDRYPFTEEKTAQKLKRLATIRKLLQDPFLESSDDPQLKQLKTAASTTHKIPLDSVPDFLKAPFTSLSGEVGNLVIIHPSVGLSDGRNSMNFTDDVGEVRLTGDKVYYAGSTSIVASDMLRLMQSEAPLMVTLTLIFIIILKLLILRRLKWMLLALLPLVLSFLWLFGIMDTVGWKLNFYNLVVLPTILGIGDDSGIHLVHRYLEEGEGSIGLVLRSTGEHVTVSALTTMLGFGGLLFSLHPGIQSIGELAVTGIGLSLFAALFLLPSLLYLLEKKDPKTTSEKAVSSYK